MKPFLLKLSIIAALAVTALQAQAWDLGYLVSGATKVVKATTLSDADMAQYVSQAVKQMDAQNKVAPSSSQYAQRLQRLTQGLYQVEGIPLNFKVYMTSEVNAFACADGSVRVYSGIMDIMSDNELLGIIGHEIGHVALKHSKKATKAALMNSALRDGLVSYGGAVGSLSASMLGGLTEAMINSKYSRKQENQADDYGYKFLKAHNKNPWAMAMSFEKLKKMEKSSSTVSKYMTKMFSDHPDTDKRIKRMSAKATADGYTRPQN